jgi:hypothetical protein
MPRRTTTRAEDRANRILDEREHNRAAAEEQAKHQVPEPSPPF